MTQTASVTMVERTWVRAIGFATVAFALAGRACFTSRRFALQSTIARRPA
jgi:hypothetical protein